MNINASLWIQWIPFAILAWVTAKFIWPPIAKALDERAAKIADGLAAADKAKAELTNANKAVEAQLAQTRTETTKLLGDAEKRAAAIVEEAKRKAVDEAAKIVAEAKAEADLQVTRARDQLRDEVAALAVKGAEAILRKEVNAAAHAELLTRLKTEL